MYIYLRRHAHSTGNQEGIVDSRMDTELSEKGREQAAGLVSKLNAHDFDLFVVSPLKRTLHTIAPYLETVDQPVIMTSGLVTERDAGEFTGKPLAEMQEHIDKRVLDRVAFRPEGGESMLEVYARAKKFLAFARETAERPILLCSHKNFLHCVEFALTGKTLSDFYDHRHLENAEFRRYEL